MVFKNTYNFEVRMLCFPNCKINTGLYITRKRADGYHDLETVFYPIAITDVLEITEAGETEIVTTGDPVQGRTEDNLIYKAWRMMQAKFPDRVRAVRMHLHKVIPMGAGLGGGSSDGTHMLRILNDKFGLDCTDAVLEEMALALGSDCPFFVKNQPVFASGRGEKFEPCALDLSAYSIQVVVPDIHVSTAAAFGMIRPKAAAYDLRQLGTLPVAEWRHRIQNDFEEPVFALHPGLYDLRKQLYRQGAIYASMSGSGSAIYGIFPKGEKAEIQSESGFRLFYVA
jgi:4-diphosphocytidyl-2-C-methyl-D-erythritol kinase